MNKTPTGARFIVASKNGSAKPLSDLISEVSKLFLAVLKVSWKNLILHMLQNVLGCRTFAIVTKLNKIIPQKKLKVFQLSALPHSIR